MIFEASSPSESCIAYFKFYGKASVGFERIILESSAAKLDTGSGEGVVTSGTTYRLGI